MGSSGLPILSSHLPSYHNCLDSFESTSICILIITSYSKYISSKNFSSTNLFKMRQSMKIQDSDLDNAAKCQRRNQSCSIDLQLWSCAVWIGANLRDWHVLKISNRWLVFYLKWRLLSRGGGGVAQILDFRQPPLKLRGGFHVIWEPGHPLLGKPDPPLLSGTKNGIYYCCLLLLFVVVVCYCY